MAPRRKSGKRYANGKLLRPTADEQRDTAWQTKTQALERRCRLAGLSPTHENLRRADRAGATLWGQYWLAGVINERQFMAADKFAELRAAYRRAMDLPPETARGVDLLAAGVRGGVSTVPDTRKPEIALYDALRAAVGDGRLSILRALACGMRPHEEPLREALDMVADWFRIEV